MIAADRERLRRLIDEHKRHEIAVAHGRALEQWVETLTDCAYCGATIPSTRRYCDQACINASRGHRVRP